MTEKKFYIRSNGKSMFSTERTWRLTIVDPRSGKPISWMTLNREELEDLHLTTGRGIRLECEELT